MTESAYTRLTAAELLTILKLALGGKGSHTADKETLIQVAIINAAKRVWYHANWRWRCLPYDLSTTASQAYTTLPADYRNHRVIRHLWFDDDPTLTCRYVSAALWPEILRQNAINCGTDAARPTHCTIRLRTVESSNIFVMEWSPTPDDDYTVHGFEYLKSLPSIDFAGSSNIFPEGEFDVLWQAAAFRAAVTGGLQLKGDTEYEKVMGVREFDELMHAAEDRWAIEDGNAVDTAWPDADDMLGSFASQDNTISGM